MFMALTVEEICKITGVEYSQDDEVLKKRFRDLGQDARDKEDFSRWLRERTPLWLACQHLNCRNPDELLKLIKTLQEAAQNNANLDQQKAS
jgi:hypothetical protein